MDSRAFGEDLAATTLDVPVGFCTVVAVTAAFGAAIEASLGDNCLAGSVFCGRGEVCDLVLATGEGAGADCA